MGAGRPPCKPSPAQPVLDAVSRTRSVSVVVLAATLTGAVPARAQQVAAPPPTLQVAAPTTVQPVAKPAEPPPPPPRVAVPAPVALDSTPPKPPSKYAFYGWIVASTVALSDALLIASAALVRSDPVASDRTLGAAILLRFPGPMVVHRFGTTKNPNKALGSAALEALGPVTGLIIATRLDPDCGPKPTAACEAEGRRVRLAGAAIGAVIGTVIDVTALGWQRRTGPGLELRLGMAPMVFARGAGVGVNGSF